MSIMKRAWSRLRRPARVLDRSGNWAVIQLTGRRHPGVFLQGDTFNTLVELIEQAPEPLPEDLEELREELQALRRYYESVLTSQGLRRPYA